MSDGTIICPVPACGAENHARAVRCTECGKGLTGLRPGDGGVDEDRERSISGPERWLDRDLAVPANDLIGETPPSAVVKTVIESLRSPAEVYEWLRVEVRLDRGPRRGIVEWCEDRLAELEDVDEVDVDIHALAGATTPASAVSTVDRNEDVQETLDEDETTEADDSYECDCGRTCTLQEAGEKAAWECPACGFVERVADQGVPA